MNRFARAVTIGYMSALLAVVPSCYAPREPRVTVEPPSPPAGDVPDANTGSDRGEPVQLSDALGYAWYHHPRMRSARNALAAASDRMLVAQLWPNPRLRVDLADEEKYKTFHRTELYQTLELGGKRDARMSVAAAQAFARQAGAVAAWSSVRAAVKRTHARHVYLKKRKLHLQDLQGIAARQHALASKLVAAGKKPADFPAVFAVSLAEQQTALAVNEDRVADAIRQFSVALGQPVPSAARGGEPAPREDVPIALPDYAMLHGRVTNASPALVTARTAVRLARARLQSARASRWADPKFGAHLKHFEYDADGESSDQFGVALEVDLPLRSLSRADTRAAANEVAASREDARAVALSVAAELSQLLADARRLEAELGALEKTARPQAENTLRLADARYRQGKTDAFARLEAQRERVGVGLEALDRRWQLTVAHIELERLGAVLRPPD